MRSLAEFVLHHRKWVMLLWAAMFIVGAFSAGKATERLTVDFSLPGQPGYETSVKILEQYGNGGGESPPYLPVVTVPEGSTAVDEMDTITAVFDEISVKVPGVRITDYAQTKDEVFLTQDDRSTYAWFSSRQQWTSRLRWRVRPSSPYSIRRLRRPVSSGD